MGDRNTGIRSSQIKNLTIQTEDIAADAVDKTKINPDIAGNGLIQAAGGELDVNVDDFTLKIANNILKIADRIELNLMLNAFRIACLESTESHGMVDGLRDDFDDESGIDTGASANEDYDSGNDLYKPTSVAGLELDYMEYANDGAAQAAYVSSGVVASPLVHYKLNDNAANTDVDDSMNANEGTASANTNTMSVAGKINTALEFVAGSSEYIDCGVGDALNITGAMSIAFWIKTTYETSSCIIKRYSSDPYPGYGVFLNRTTVGKFDIFIDDGGWRTNLNSSTIHDGDWHHIVITGTGTSGIIYVDGSSDGTFTYANPSTNSGDNCYIGSHDGAHSFLTGYLDDFRIYNFALTQGEIDAINNGGSGTEEQNPSSTLRCYSEDTEVQQGTYSLKAIAAQTDSLNETLTKSGLSIDLSGKNTLKFDIRSSRLGSNIKLGIKNNDHISNADIDDEDMADISDWDDNDSEDGVSSQVTFDSKSCMKLDSGPTAAANNQADRRQDFGSFATRTVFSFSLYCDALGTITNNDHLKINFSDGTTFPNIAFTSDGLYIHDGDTWVLIDADIIVQDSWQEWAFDVDWVAQTVDVYLGRVLKYADVALSVTGGTNGEVRFIQYGHTTAHRLSYIDWFKVGSDFTYTTTEKTHTISIANTWETDTWDISGIADTDKDAINQIVITIINADAINTFYIDNFYAPGLTNNMTLISNSFTAEAAPEDARIVLFEEDVDSITENTDIKVYVSRDGGSTYVLVTLVDEGDYQSGKRILTGVVDLTQSGIGSGTNMEYKIETLNNKSLKLHGVGLHWD